MGVPGRGRGCPQRTQRLSGEVQGQSVGPSGRRTSAWTPSFSSTVELQDSAETLWARFGKLFIVGSSETGKGQFCDQRVDDGRPFKSAEKHSGNGADGDILTVQGQLGRLFYESKYNPDKLPKSIC